MFPINEGHINTDQSLCTYIHIWIFVCTLSWVSIQAVVLIEIQLAISFLKRRIHYMLNSFISKTLKWPNKHNSRVQITESKPNMRRSSLSRAQLLIYICLHVCVCLCLFYVSIHTSTWTFSFSKYKCKT